MDEYTRYKKKVEDLEEIVSNLTSACNDMMTIVSTMQDQINELKLGRQDDGK